MATLAATNVTASYLNAPAQIGPFNFEVYRVPGGTVGDTATIAPARGRFVIAAGGVPASTTLSTAGTATNVVFTLIASAATDVTFDAWLLVQP